MEVTEIENLNEMLEYLDGVRVSGVVNMFFAGPYLETNFGIDAETARAVLAYWMRTFSERNIGR